MSILKKISHLFAPEVEKNLPDGFGDTTVEGGMVSANQILDAIMRHFQQTVSRLSTKYTFLYHTSFTVYLKAANYQEISDSLPFIASGAEQMLTEEINNQVKNRPGYKPHSSLWQFQLVEIPEDAEIDGISREEMQQSVVVQIQSSLFPPTERNQETGSGRIVTTVQGINSLRAIRNCINPEILGRLHLVERDRIQLSLNLDPAKRVESGRRIPRSDRPARYVAVLVAEEGRFLDNRSNQPIHTVAMISDELHISGRNAMGATQGAEVVRIDSDRILNPHVRIRRDPTSGQFQLAAIGKTVLNQRTLASDPDKWVTLSKKSTIILDDDIQIQFKAS